MTRRRWIGLAGVLFGVLMLAGVTASGSTPENTGGGAAQRYADFWADTGNQDGAVRGSVLLTYAFPLLAVFAAGLRWLVRDDDGPLPGVVLGAGAAAAAAFATGAALINGVGLAAAESGYEPDGGTALVAETVGYYALVPGVMCAGAMAVALSLSNRRVRVLPQWTAVLSGLLLLAGLGSIFTAWAGFMLLPLWAAVMGVVLLATSGRDRAEVGPAHERLPA